MKILITGATGLVGSKLLEELYLLGHEDITILTRNKNKAKATIAFPVEVREWNPSSAHIEEGSLDGIDIVFHLAGENVASGRWTQKRKQAIEQSRIKSTQLLLEAIKKSKTTPTKFISAGAVGIYGNTENQEITEQSPLADDFLAGVCKSWEETLEKSDISGMQTHVLRTGIVLSKNGGALAKMLPPFKMGVGGKLGSGNQYMSWIHIEDLVRAYIYLMENDCKSFAYNGVSPQPLTNIEFTKVLGKQLRRPTISPVPGFVLKMIFGEMSQILLGGQRVYPTRLKELSFEFKYNNLSDALAHEFSHESRGEVHYKRYQWVNTEKDNVFDFFVNEKNLEKITPPTLGFKVVNKSTPAIQTGTLIDYKLSIHGVPAKWQTRITSFKTGESFIDEQLKGPYKKWVHHHSFKNVKNGTLICDEVVYKLPLGALGQLVAGWFVKKDVNNIFNFRNKVIGKLF